MATKGTTLLEMTAFRIKESETTLTKDYAVQGQILLGWLTIRKFSASKTSEKGTLVGEGLRSKSFRRTE